MLGRAANAQTQRSDTPQISNTASANASQLVSKQAESAAFDRLIAAVGERSTSQPQAQSASDQPHAPQIPVAAVSSQSAPAVSAVQTQAVTLAAAVIDPESIIEQMVKSMTMRSSGGTSQVNLRLQPDHLGSVALKITVTGTTIDANVIAQSGHVRDLLVNGQQQLARSLSDAGLTLGTFSVDVSGGNAGFTGRHAQHQHAPAKAGSFGVALDDEDPQTDDGRFGPPLIAPGQSIVLNYLA
jgi:flagellar hook-length control protein FliK